MKEVKHTPKLAQKVFLRRYYPDQVEGCILSLCLFAEAPLTIDLPKLGREILISL